MEIKGIDIVNFREKHRLSQSEFANLIGVHPRTIQNYEAGSKIPESKYGIFRNVFKNYESSKNQASEPPTSYQEDLAEYNKELSNFKVKTLDALREVAYKFLANEKELYEHNLLPDNREMHFWLRYKEIVDKYGSVDNYLQQEI